MKEVVLGALLPALVAGISWIVTDRVYRRDPAAVRRRMVERELLRGRSIDLVVIADPQSLVTVSELADVIMGMGARLSYSVADARLMAGNAEG